MTLEADCESHFAIRKKMSVRERRTASVQGFPENFFIAKKCDSESAQGDFHSPLRLGATNIRCRLLVYRMKNIAAAQSLPATLTNVDVEFSRVICIAAPMRRRIVVKRAVVVPKTLRQHFLKRDAVFFNVLVYSD
jgi:hypothetical protein